jgi:malonyl CoA-acyl carrier protein transacylase
MARDGQLAVLFPGQGSQTRGMRELVARLRPDLLELAPAIVGEDPFALVEEGTRFAQPAIFCAALAGWDDLKTELRPDFLAGHSLGELTALAAAGALSDTDALRLVAARGRLMQEAQEAGGDGGMLAVGASIGDVGELAARHDLAVANDNSPEQVVLSGPEAGLEAAVAELQERGVRAKRLRVRGAFHSPAMESALPRFRSVLDEVEVREPQVPVFSCVTAEPFDDPRERLAQALTSPVRWLDVLRALRARGVERFVETGPGRVLTGLVRHSLDGVEAEAPVRLEPAHA